MGELEFRYKASGCSVLVVVAASLVLAYILASIPTSPPSSPEYQCCNNLKQLGGLFQARQAGGKLEYTEGPAFFLQFRDEIRPEWMSVYRCPEGPEDVLISYRGPDATALERIRNPGGKSIMIACDANGENGEDPYHDDGVCVLWSTGKTEIIPWEEMEGYDGDPVKVGPGSPDPRFRHLVR